jgi:hypothetical protein
MAVDPGPGQTDNVVAAETLRAVLAEPPTVGCDPGIPLTEWVSAVSFTCLRLRWSRTYHERKG